jgi:hypothetical protein
MKSLGLIYKVASLLLPAVSALAGVGTAPQVGDAYVITLVKDSSQHGAHGSSGSTHDKDTIVERVIALRADGLELEYDLPSTATADERAREWQLPARVFKPFDGPAQLLNAAELERRVDGWLKFGNMTRAACGHWIFTWNAFLIDCDPQSVLKIIESYDLRSAEVREGASYPDKDALTAGTLAKKAGGTDNLELAVELPVDPEPVRRARAQSDVVVGEIMHKPVSLETALSNHAKDVVSGTISITFDMDPAGNVRRRAKVTKTDITDPSGISETQTVTETLERRLISR